MAAYNIVESLILANLADGSSITAEKHREVEKALLDFAESQWLTGDIKEIDCDNTYITNNFDSSGLGINDREGWAICNGNNGTRNRTGRVSVAWGDVAPIGTGATQFPLMGTTSSPTIGGANEHSLTISEMPPHSHNIARSTSDVDGTTFSAGSGTGSNNTTQSAGGSGGNVVPHNNMQPYIVTLFIQKL